MAMPYQVCFPAYAAAFPAAAFVPVVAGLGMGVQVVPWQPLPVQAGACAGLGAPAATVAAASSSPARPAMQEPPRPPRAPRRRLQDLPLQGNVWRLSQDPAGCRRVQAALAEAQSDSAREAIVGELRGHVWEAVLCPHGNYVIQQVVTTMRASSCRFVVDEIVGRGTGAVCKVARHAFGCRVLQRVLEHWPDQAGGLVDDLSTEGLLLCRHSFGNYVMQHVLEYGCEAHRAALIRGMEQHALALGSDSRASGPLAKAIAHGLDDERTLLARALLVEKKVLVSMACTRHGHVAVQSILQLCDAPERQEAVRQLKEHARKLQASRYGRAVLHCVPGPEGSAAAAAAAAAAAGGA